jgi:hypothetical protein
MPFNIYLGPNGTINNPVSGQWNVRSNWLNNDNNYNVDCDIGTATGIGCGVSLDSANANIGPIGTLTLNNSSLALTSNTPQGAVLNVSGTFVGLRNSTMQVPGQWNVNSGQVIFSTGSQLYIGRRAEWNSNGQAVTISGAALLTIGGYFTVDNEIVVDVNSTVTLQNCQITGSLVSNGTTNLKVVQSTININGMPQGFVGLSVVTLNANLNGMVVDVLSSGCAILQVEGDLTLAAAATPNCIGAGPGQPVYTFATSSFGTIASPAPQVTIFGQQYNTIQNGNLLQWSLAVGHPPLQLAQIINVQPPVQIAIDYLTSPVTDGNTVGGLKYL